MDGKPWNLLDWEALMGLNKATFYLQRLLPVDICIWIPRISEKICLRPIQDQGSYREAK